MRLLVAEAIRQPEFQAWARSIVLGVPRQDRTAQAYAVRDFIAHRIAFVRDPVGVESLTAPMQHMRWLIRRGAVLGGDCDDAATLSAALGMAIGIPASFTLTAYRGGPWQHVYTTLHPPRGQPVDVDTTRDAQGLPPTPDRRLTVRV